MFPTHAKDKFETYERSKEIGSEKWVKKEGRRKGKERYFGGSDTLLSLTNKYPDDQFQQVHSDYFRCQLSTENLKSSSPSKIV